MHRPALIAYFDAIIWQPATSSVFQTTVFAGVLLLVVLLVFFWAVYWRTPRRRRHAHGRRPVSHHMPITPLPEPRKRIPWLVRAVRFNRHHYRYRHRPANPTLADMGGLPPQRNEPPRAA